MRSIMMSSMRARLVVVSIAAILMVIGISQLRDIQLGVFPEFSPVYVEVQTEALGLSADEVEQLLTVALEQDLLNGIAYLDKIWSESMPGLSRVVCVFEPGTDPMVARQVVAERLTQAHALPHVSKPPVMLQPYSSTSRVMKVGLTPNTPELSLIDLSVLARWTIQPYLMGVEGVANVSIWGQRKRQLQVQVDPEILQERNIALQDIIETTGEALWVSPLSYLNSSTPGTGGFFDTPNQRLGIRHLLPISTPEELAKVPVVGHNVSLGEVTNVLENHQPLIGDAIVNGTQGLMLVIEKFPWASTRKVTERVDEALDALEPGLTGIAFDSDIYQPANFIEASFANLAATVSIGLGLVIILFFLFYGEWRAVLISTVAIVLSLLAGAYVLFLQGTIFNMMILAGFIMALGIIIDDAVTNVSNIRKHLQQRREKGSDRSIAATILDAAMETRSPLLYAATMMALAITPLFFFEGVTGAFLSPLASSYLLALATSTLTAVIVIPVLALMFLPGASGYKESSVWASLTTSIGSAFSNFVKSPTLAYATLGIVVLLGLIAIPMIDPGPQLPIPKERDILISWDAPYGTSHPEMTRLTKEVIGKLRTIPRINNVAAHLGRAVLSDKITNMHAGEIWVSMDDEADYKETLAAINQVVSGYTEMSTKVTTYREQTLNKSLTGVDHMYAVRVYGENQNILKQKAEEIQKALGSAGAISDAKVEYPPLEPTLEIEVDLEKARQYNLKPGDVRRTAATLLAGLEVGSLFEGQKVFEVVVWGIPEVRNSIESVNNLLVDTPTGSHVRIGEVAEVREQANPAVIRREKVSRFMDVSFSYTGHNMNALNTSVNQVISQVEFPLEYHAELVGEFADIREAKGRVWGIVITALIGAFLLMQALFWSWRLAMVVFPSLLFSVSGGLQMVLLSGGVLSAGALAGLFAVLGIATYQGVLLIKYCKDLELRENMAFGPELVLKGLRDRAGSILMTTILAAVAMLPFAVMGNAPGLEMVHPMSVVVLGGLVTSVLVNLAVLPALYLGFGKVSEAVIEEEKSMLEAVPSIS